ncbi:MAG TPA: Uma2 family endonuclease [Bryobacteraceae bacterium]|nr:Uma2 family endonuclease [Bryobacteraceae bacterium]
MNVVFPERTARVKFIFDSKRAMSDDAFYQFCIANPDLRMERTEQGEIVIVPPAGYESDFRNADVVAQLTNWAKRDRRGRASGPTTVFILPNGAALSPDAAWISNGRIEKVPKAERRGFMRVSPEFVVEVMSPSDRLKDAKGKMEVWIRSGVALAWLIDADRKTVHIYRAHGESETRSEIRKLAGEGPMSGFTLDLTEIWAGL